MKVQCFSIYFAILLLTFSSLALAKSSKTGGQVKKKVTSIKEPIDTIKKTVLTKKIEKNTIDYSKYPGLFYSPVHLNGFIDYKWIQQNPQDLKKFLEKIASVSKEDYSTWEKDTKIAFWINCHNAMVINKIVNSYPEKDHILKDMTKKGLVKKIQKDILTEQCSVMGSLISLDSVQSILRYEFKEPKIHFALILGTEDTPGLSTAPYTSSSLKSWLVIQTIKSLRDPQIFKIDINKKVVYLSRIFKKIEEDLNKIAKIGDASNSDLRSLSYILPYVNSSEKEFIQNENYKIKYLNPSWTLREHVN